ncbi:YhdP family protein [Marinobacter sp.]|uniref:YhdP family protein n=1 Tax=Marinobacter sp. TaxID=50741 RepID=UPI00384AE486
MSTPPAESGSGRLIFRVLLRLANLIWWLVLVVLVLLALYTAVGRQLAQNIDSWRDELEQAVSSQLGRSVTIGGLKANWHWLDPVVEAEGLRVHHADDPERVIAELRHLRLRLDTIASLLRLRVVFGEFQADGLDFTLTRTSDGPVRVGGIEVLERTESVPWLDRAGALLSDPYVRITRVNLGLDVPGEPVQYVDIPQVDLIYERGRFTATGRAMRSGTTDQIASFNLQGKHFFRGDFDGQLYVDLNSGRLFDGLLKGMGWNQLKLQGFDIRGEAWLTFRSGFLAQGNGDIRVPYLQLNAGHETLAPVEDLTARIGWRRGSNDAEAETGELHLRNLSWRWAGTRADSFDLLVDRDLAGFSVMGHDIPIEPVWRLADSFNLMPPAASAALADYRPAGKLNQVRARIPGAGREDFSLTAELDGVEVAAHGGAPGATGLTGDLFVSPRGGWVDVDSSDVGLGFPDLFQTDWTFDRLSTRVSWILEDGLTRIFSDRVRMEYEGETEISGAFDLRMGGGSESTLSLRVGLRNGNADMLNDFVPARLVGEELYDWLTTAIEQARITEGVYYGHGTIGANAASGSFTSSMTWQFDDARIRYHPQWPRVTDATGHVTVHENQADIHLESGQTGGLTLAPTDIAVLPGPEINVDTGSAMSGQEVRSFLEQTPLWESVGPGGQGITMGGDYELDLALGIPLGSEPDVFIDARLRTANGELHYPGMGLSWSIISGEVRYQTGKGFSPEPLTAVFLGQPVDVRFATDQGSDRLRISQRGRMKVAALLDQTEIELPGEPGLEGSFNYTAELALAADQATRFTVESSLIGVAVDWPEPLGKPAPEAAPLTLTADWRDNAMTVNGSLGERMAASARWLSGRFDRGMLVVGPGEASLPVASGLHVSATMTTMNIPEWQERLEKTLGDGAAGEMQSPDSWLSSMEIKAGSVEVGGESFPDTTLVVTPAPGEWQLEVESRQIAGRAVVPLGEGPISVNLARLLIDEEAVAAGSQEWENPDAASPFRTWQVDTWPDVEVQIDSLQYGLRDYGAWSFRLEPEADALTVTSISGQLSELGFTGELAWRLLDQGEQTRLSGELSGGSLAGLSTVMDGAVPLKNEKSEVILDLTWPGAPQDISLPAMEGSISLRLDEGVILEKSNTAQVFRVFNLLNSDTLWRRLKLDFSDLYEAGVTFDAISGKAELAEGTLSWDPELQIVGPSGAFRLSGSTNLETENLDMRLVVVLPLTQNLPLAALLMGASAPIGGALFVLDKVLGDPLSKLTSATYSVEGTWDSPEVKLRNVFDRGGD